jgi:hypothetical protein
VSSVTAIHALALHLKDTKGALLSLVVLINQLQAATSTVPLHQSVHSQPKKNQLLQVLSIYS